MKRVLARLGVLIMLGVLVTVHQVSAAGSHGGQSDGAVEATGVSGRAVLASTEGDGYGRDEVSCSQIADNPGLDVVEFGPGSGSAEPWQYLDPVIYYVKQGDGSGLAFEGSSLVLPDGDEGDPTPTGDILSQIITFPPSLQSTSVSYQRAMLDANPQDKAFGEFWRLTSEGEIDLSKPDEYRLARWQISDSERAWAKETVYLESGLLPALSGQTIALLMLTETNGGGATETEKEWLLLDDITVTACARYGDVFLPVVQGN